MSSLLTGGVPHSGLDLSNPLVCAFVERLFQQQQQQQMAQHQPASLTLSGGTALGGDLPSIGEVKRAISQSLRASGDVGSLPPIRSTLPTVFVPQHQHHMHHQPQHHAVGGIGWLQQQQQQLTHSQLQQLQQLQHHRQQQNLSQAQPSLNLAMQHLQEPSQARAVYQNNSGETSPSPQEQRDSSSRSSSTGSPSSSRSQSMACSSASTVRNGSINPSSSSKTYRGVSRSGVNSRWRAQLSSRGKTIHLGTFPTADEAARAWDIAVIAERGGEVETNFALSDYLDEFGALRNMALTKGGGGGVGRNEYRGVYNSGSYGRWKARIVVNGRKIHLGTYATAEEAARAWDRRAIKERGATTLTNFDPSEYANEPEGTGARSLSDGEEEEEGEEEAADDNSSSSGSSNNNSSSGNSSSSKNSSSSRVKKCRFAPDTRGGVVEADEVGSDDGVQGSSGSDDGAQGSSGSDDGTQGSSEDSSEGSASPKGFRDEGDGEGVSKVIQERGEGEMERKNKRKAMDGAVESLLSLCRWGDNAGNRSGGGEKLCGVVKGSSNGSSNGKGADPSSTNS